MEFLRSLIFVPGNRRDMLEKARDFDADVVIADLEDSVPPAEKLKAARTVSEMAPSLTGRGQKVMVRVNSLDTGLTRDELSTLIGPHLYGISVGKVESAWDIEEYSRLASVIENGAGLESGHLKIIPWIENAMAVINAHKIATASPRVVAVAFGAEDFTNDMGAERTDAGQEVHFPRAMVALAARAAGVLALDGPYVRYRDQDGLKKDAQAARGMGFKGKFAIHPAQLDIINEVFCPNPEEVEYARKVVEVWDKAEASGRGSTTLDGKMIDIPVVKRARSVLAIHDEITHRKKPGSA